MMPFRVLPFEVPAPLPSPPPSPSPVLASDSYSRHGTGPTNLNTLNRLEVIESCFYSHLMHCSTFQNRKLNVTKLQRKLSVVRCMGDFKLRLNGHKNRRYNRVRNRQCKRAFISKQVLRWALTVT